MSELRESILDVAAEVKLLRRQIKIRDLAMKLMFYYQIGEHNSEKTYAFARTLESDGIIIEEAMVYIVKMGLEMKDHLVGLVKEKEEEEK